MTSFNIYNQPEEYDKKCSYGTLVAQWHSELLENLKVVGLTTLCWSYYF